jgi:hypothetical protein
MQRRTRQATHPLGEVIMAAAGGQFPPVDGDWERVQPWRPEVEAVVSFTGHAVFAVSAQVLDDLLISLGADGFGGAHDPRLIAALAGHDGWIDSLDVLLATRGTTDAARMVRRPDLATHPRAQLAAQLRDDVETFGYPQPERSALATLGRGVAGLLELSFEIEPERRGGAGTSLVQDALSVVPAGQLVVTAVAPGNAASLRAVLRAGFTPLGSLQLFRRG